MSADTRIHRRKSFTAAVLTAAVIGLTFIAQNWHATENVQSAPRLVVDIVDAQTGKPTAARFGLIVDGQDYVPSEVGSNGIRFVSVHKSRNQIYPVTYARGNGPVTLSIPADAKQVTVYAARGFEYLPAEVSKKITDKTTHVHVELKRWTNLAAKGWRATDAHVHYDRLHPKENEKWLAMLAGDDLHGAQFMVLKGGQVPGLWAQQYAYGKKGEAFDGQRLICSGEEYRDGAQGHINLFAIREVIQPISTGGIGKPPVRFNYPPLHDVFQKSRDLGGFGGVAHGASLGRSPTAILDTVLGKVDFFEIANAHLYAPELWYRLLNCGYDIPPTAGTDLPNYPYRDKWQPFLGSMRMYVKVGGQRDFHSWKSAVRDGRVFITSGPLITFHVEKAVPGEDVALPKNGGKVTLTAELSSPIGLRSFEIIRNGKPLAATVRKRIDKGIHRWTIEATIDVNKSCWLAARGKGVEIQSLAKLNWPNRPWIQTSAVAHTAPVRVLVDRQPIRSDGDVKCLVRQLQEQQEYYRTKGVFADGKHRLQMLGLFDMAITELKKRRSR